MILIKRILPALVLGLACAGAGAMEASPAVPVDDDTPVLTVRAAGETRQLSLREIESTGLVRTEMTHFEGLEGVFTGVRLEAFLETFGLDGFQRLRFIAADDYTTFLRPEELERKDYMLVTRYRGEPIPLHRMGPLMLIVPADEEAVLAGSEAMTKWIWSIKEIRAR